ncbi:PaaI family thioesterase [Actinomycetospora endophytica]|uniref:Acyl-coenzyme A thioesterase THEM4 n=1 Tax=Actinomycetospora endophytica TaxID=2291215 RepID=A0ABS8P906_9PSEU|nr:PaaI family thioesterase [Actinomycetospora endophytica]MCD2194744.1 PaaI family thioesterase [Actinomycetospora endophytica]
MSHESPDPRPEPVAPAALVRTDGSVTDRTWDGHLVPEGYSDMIDGVRELLDRIAAAVPGADLVASTTKAVAELNDRFAEHAVAEPDQLSGRLITVPGRAQLAVPAVHIDEIGEDGMSGHVWFGRHFLGSNGVVHGGAIPMLFDDLLGRFAIVGGGARSRTAFLHVDYRSVAPIETTLRVTAHVERVEGRKHFLRGELLDGDRLCAEASALFLTLKDGQQ